MRAGGRTADAPRAGQANGDCLMIDDDPPWTCLAQPFARGRCLAHLHLTDGRIDRGAITKLADLSPITNDGYNIRPSAPPHADAAAGFQPSTVSFEACTFGLQNSGGLPPGDGRHRLPLGPEEGRAARITASRPPRHPLPRILFDERSRSAGGPAASSNAFRPP